MNGKEKWETKWKTGTSYKGREGITEILLAKKGGGGYFVQGGDEGPGVGREEGGGEEGRNPI